MVDSEGVTGASTRILVADDHEFVRRGVRSLLESQAEFEVCGEAVDGVDAVNRAKQLNPDVVVLDISMPNMNGLDAARQIRKEVPHSEILILSQHDSSEIVKASLDAGARGYIVKSDIARDLLMAVKTVTQHKIAFSSTIAQRQTAAPGTGKVSERRQRQNLEFLAGYWEMGDMIRELFMHAPTAVGLLRGPEHRWTFLNRTCLEILGGGAEQFLGKTIRETLPELQEQGYLEILDKAYRSGTPFVGTEMEVRLSGARKKANEVYFNFVYQPLRNLAGEVEGIMVNAVEVTDQVLARRALEESEEKFRTLFRHAPVGEACVDASGKFLDVNHAYCRMTGYGREELLERALSDLSYPEDRTLNQRVFEQHADRSDPSHQVEMRYVRKDGSVLWVRTSASEIPSPGGGPGYAVVFATEITGREQAEEELRRSAEETRSRLAAIVESSDDAIISKDLTGVITSWNAGAQRMFGYSEAEAIGRSITMIIPPELRHEESEILRQLRAGTRIEHYQTVRVSKEGKRVNVSLTVSPVKDAAGRVIGASKIARDVSARVQADEALRKAHDDLESQVEQRTAALRLLSARLLQVQDEERRRIARELHDSLGQLLSAAQINLDVVLSTEAPAYDMIKEARALVERSLAETRTLSHLLHPPLLDEAGFDSAARWYIDGFSRRSGIPVMLDMPEELERLPRLVEVALFRILQESLTNVHRHSGSSSVSIRLYLHDAQVSLEVQDYGRGIAADMLERFRKNGTNVGMGLAGMRERAKELGGIFDIRSHSRGTLLKVTLPAREAEGKIEPAASGGQKASAV